MCRDELKDKTLSDRWLRMNPRFKVVLNDDGDTYVIKDTKSNEVVTEIGDATDLKWTTRKAAEEFLTVSLMLGKIKC